MSSPTPQPAGNTRVVPNEFPLRFDHHTFDAYCYNASDCSVVYDGFEFFPKELSPEGTVFPPPPSADYREKWRTSYIVEINFPPPAIVKWRSKDGAMHETRVDIGEIFKDRRILHRVPESEIPEGWAHNLSAGIVLEVNDRTVSVYMKAHVATRTPQVPGNRYSDFRADPVLAWSKTF